MPTKITLTIEGSPKVISHFVDGIEALHWIHACMEIIRQIDAYTEDPEKRDVAALREMLMASLNEFNLAEYVTEPPEL